MGQYCFACWRLLSVVCSAADGRAGRQARGRPLPARHVDRYLYSTYKSKRVTRRSTLHGGQVRLHPVRATLCLIIEIFADLFTCTDLSFDCCTFCYQQCTSICFLQIYTGWLILSLNAQEYIVVHFGFLSFFAMGWVYILRSMVSFSLSVCHTSYFIVSK